MLPSFIDQDLAQKIFSIGKSINFIRICCQDSQWMIQNSADQPLIQPLEWNVSDMSSFRSQIHLAYKETSSHLLGLLKTKFRISLHLEALRRYLLLGQGDFTQQLMDLLEPELSKDASALYLHNLTGILESTVRSTNAQYDDPDVLKRLDVKLLEASPGDSGWEVFSLDYHIDSPLNTVVSQDSMQGYLRVFNFLWKLKRIEFSMKLVWKARKEISPILKVISDGPNVFHKSHVLHSEMFHFLHQVQYYFVFEVLECSWNQLCKQIDTCQDLDQLVNSHHQFLNEITNRLLLGPKTSTMLNQLRTIFDLITQYTTLFQDFKSSLQQESFTREKFASSQVENSLRGTWGMVESSQASELQRQENFNSLMSGYSNQLTVIHKSFQDMLCRFLSGISNSVDLNLKFLSFRLDFNEFYSQKNPIYLKVGQSSFTT
eukprot:Sdes_comp20176_c0_seq1m13395